MSFLSRHRTICAVIQEIQDAASQRGDTGTVKLCDEAFTYARAMSAKLTQYKYEHSTNKPVQDVE